jgi:hypothetical protein
MQRQQGHGDGRAVGFAIDVPAFDPEGPPHPLKVGNGDTGAEIVQIEPVRCGLGVARRIGRTAFSEGIVAWVFRDGEGGINKRTGVIRAELRLRSAGPPLIDENEITT